MWQLELDQGIGDFTRREFGKRGNQGTANGHG